jgi:Protein of unknown function (DUF2442)
MKLPENRVILVKAAEFVKDHQIRLTFSDGKQQVVDFGPFLNRSNNPLIRAYLEPGAFQRFAIKDGDLIWDDYELCFPIADLYEGEI